MYTHNQLLNYKILEEQFVFTEQEKTLLDHQAIKKSFSSAYKYQQTLFILIVHTYV